MRYQRDANTDIFVFSESSYDDYGNAAAGAYCDADGNVDRPTEPQRRRPRDTATITTAATASATTAAGS